MPTDLSNIATALRYLREGDLTVRLSTTDMATREVAVEFNQLVAQIEAIRREIGRVCKEMGVHGKFGGQIDTSDVDGAWFDMLADVNRTARTLTIQLRAASMVASARVSGEIDTVLTAPAEGEMRCLFDLVNAIGREPAASV